MPIKTPRASYPRRVLPASWSVFASTAAGASRAIAHATWPHRTGPVIPPAFARLFLRPAVLIAGGYRQHCHYQAARHPDSEGPPIPCQIQRGPEDIGELDGAQPVRDGHRHRNGNGARTAGQNGMLDDDLLQQASAARAAANRVLIS